jgi:hypothetical protein
MELRRHQQSTLLRGSLLVSVVGLLPACMLSPTNGQQHPSRAASVAVNGFFLAPHATVRVFSSAAKAGPFFLLTTTQTSATGFTLASGGTCFPKLASVGGELFVTAVEKPDLRLGNPAGLGVGALRVQSNPSLTTLNAAHLTVLGSGAIDISNNTNLCTSLVTSWLSSLVGWTGTSVVAGNQGC